MNRILMLLSAFLILSTGVHASAQDKKQTAETEQPKTEVDTLLEKAKEKGEIVVARCLQDCGDQTVDGNVEVGRALELPTPRYPEMARMAHVSGEVMVQLIVDVDGTVMAAAAVSGHPLLYGVSVEAAKNSRFSITKLDGKPVKVTGVITYNFASK
jgi:TonB family protein